MTHRTCDNARRVRSGFTLVELVLALGLMTILLAALYGTLDLYQRLTTAGRSDVERAQLARAVLQRIRVDLQSVVFRAAETSTATEGQQEGETDPEADPAITGELASLGLVGGPQDLLVYVSRPGRVWTAQPAFPSETGAVPQSDLRAVSWFLAVANGQGLAGAVGNLATGGSTLISRESGAQGLARLESPPGMVEQADAANNAAEFAEMSELLAPEVRYLQFNYFDGTTWSTSWDSQLLGSLPSAVEIVIGFSPAESEQLDDASRGMLGAEPIGEVYRLVVALPLGLQGTSGGQL